MPSRLRILAVSERAAPSFWCSGGFRGFQRPFAFVFVSAGRRRGQETGGGGGWRLAMRLRRFRGSGGAR